MKRKLMMVSMMAILSLSLFACGSKNTTSSSNGSARTNTEKEADTKNENVGTFSQLFTNNDVMLMYGKEASNRKQEIDRQHHTIPNKRTKDKHYGNVHNRLWNHG